MLRYRNLACTSVAAAVTLSLVIGCPSVGLFVGPNEAACRTVVSRLAECDSAFPFADLSGASDLLVSQFCATVPETGECGDWSAFADLVTSASCTQLGFDPRIIVGLDNIVVRLENNGCLPTGK